MNARRLCIRSIPFLALLALIVLFSNLKTVDGASERDFFLTWDNFRFIAAQTVTVAVAAAGMTLILAAGGIDLSVGAVIGLSGVLAAFVLRRGYPAGTAVLAALFIGALVGLTNGALVTWLRLAPVLATLGMLGVSGGLAQWIACGRFVPAPSTWLDGLMVFFPAHSWMLFSPGVWIALAAAVLVGTIARNTVFGRHIFAIGSNEETARLCGIRVPFTKIMTYATAGLLFGLAGLLQTARLHRGDPASGIGMELDIVAAALIGGANLRGGTGSIAGATIGALLLAVLRNGIRQAGWPPFAEEIAVGATLVIAATVTGWRQRKPL